MAYMTWCDCYIFILNYLFSKKIHNENNICNIYYWKLINVSMVLLKRMF